MAQEITTLGKERIDVVAVTRQIVASEPPFAADVESHIRFCKIWGGGLAQTVTRDICSYIKMCDCDITYVPSAHFDEMCKLKLSPTQMASCSGLVAAIVKCSAARSSNGVPIISSQRMKPMIEHGTETAEVQKYLKKASELCSHVQDDCTMHLGCLECDLVERLFEVTPTTEKNSMPVLVENFVRKISGNVKITSDEADAEGADEEEADKLVDVTGEDAVHQILAKKGIKVGALMTRGQRTNPFELEAQYEVAYINADGSIGVRRVKIDGRLDDAIHVVKMGDIPEYALTKKDLRFKLSPLAPMSDSIINDTACRMVAEAALYKCYKQHKDLYDDTVCQSAPRPRLLACRDFNIDELVLVPFSLGLGADDGKDAPHWIVVKCEPPVRFKVTTHSSKSYFTPFWKMSTETKDKKSANMKLTTTTLKVDWPFNIGHGKSVEVLVPIAKNDKVVKKDTEIRLLNITTGQKRKAQMQINVGDI